MAYFLPLLIPPSVIISFMSKKTLLFLSIIAISAIFLYMRSEKTGRIDLQIKGDSYIEGLKIVNKKNGTTEWVLLADRADLSKDGKDAQLTKIEVQLKQQGITVLADSGHYNIDTKKITVDGEIHAKNSNFSIVTREIDIDSIKGTLETEGEVKIEGKNFNLQGRGLAAENNEQKVRVLKDVKAVFNR